MTAPLDGELAWAISEWNDDTAGMPSTVSKLTRGEIESLTKFLTSQGYSKPKEDNGELGLNDVKKIIDKGRKTLQDFLWTDDTPMAGGRGRL